MLTAGSGFKTETSDHWAITLPSKPQHPWVEKSVRSGMRLNSGSKSERSFTRGWWDQRWFWFWDGGTDQKTVGRAGGGRVKHVEILFGSASEGQHRLDILQTKLESPDWDGYMQRRDNDIGRRMPTVELPGRNNRKVKKTKSLYLISCIAIL